MAKLEDLTLGSVVIGLHGDEPVTIVEIIVHGCALREITYQDKTGKRHVELVYRERETELSVVDSEGLTVKNESKLFEKEGTWEIGKPWHLGKEVVHNSGVYKIEDVIARGGMGIVYKARDVTSNHIVIIKSLLPEIAKNAYYRNRFVKEAEEWIGLGPHHNIVRAHTAFEIDYLPRIIAEFIDGSSLSEHLDIAELPLENAFSFAVQICWGMAFAHDKGLAHRDLKPANIMISKNGVAKITDFGLVKHFNDEAEEDVNPLPNNTLLTIGAAGTPEYCSPEQWNSKAGKASDIYAFGIILYELFCGMRPFDTKSRGLERVTVFQRLHITKAPPEPKSISPELPDELASIMVKCLEKDPQKRPPSFRDLGNQLNKICFSMIGKKMDCEPKEKELNRQGKLDHSWSLVRLSGGCINRSDHSKAIELIERANTIFEDLNEAKGISNCQINLGQVYGLLGHYQKAQEKYERALSIFKTLVDRKGIARCYGSLGSICKNLYHYDQALEYFGRALNIFEEIEDSHGISRCHVGMGIVYGGLGRHEEALKEYEIVFTICKANEDFLGIGSCLMNIGNIYKDLGNNDNALRKYGEALQIFEEIGNRVEYNRCNKNIGFVYYKMKKYDESLQKYYQALDGCKEINDDVGVQELYYILGTLCIENGKTEKALAMLRGSLKIREELDLPGKEEVNQLIRELEAKKSNPL